MKQLFLLTFLMFSLIAFGQKNEITIYPLPIKTWSAIKITAVEKGEYEVKITDAHKKILFNKTLFIEGKNGFKHNFKNYAKGRYTISLYKNSKLILSKQCKK